MSAEKWCCSTVGFGGIEPDVKGPNLPAKKNPQKYDQVVGISGSSGESPISPLTKLWNDFACGGRSCEGHCESILRETWHAGLHLSGSKCPAAQLLVVKAHRLSNHCWQKISLLFELYWKILKVHCCSKSSEIQYTSIYILCSPAINLWEFNIAIFHIAIHRW